MPQSLPALLTAQLMAERSSEALAVLVTIEDVTLSAPLRYTDQPVQRLSSDPIRYGIISSGETYVWALRSGTLPDDTAENAQSTTIEIDNIVEDAGAAVRGLSPDATISIAVVMTGVPDEQFLVTSDLRYVDRSITQETISLQVSRHANRGGAPDLLYGLSSEYQTRRKAPGLFR